MSPADDARTGPLEVYHSEYNTAASVGIFPLRGPFSHLEGAGSGPPKQEGMLLETPFDQLQPGARWVSRGRTITESDLVWFAGISGDWFPLHTDKEYAAQTAYGARIAHGMLVLSVATGLIPLPPGIILAFYGMDRVRFTRPVFIGDTIHVEMQIARKDAKGADQGLLTLALDVKNQRGETVAVSSSKILVRR